ncbi:MAG: hypothetical protein EXS63_09600 [Candidatus Omnitrophica bacterium]|nr:hypothetical protein [Candidatus Omnitrophota bacterium]
MKREKAPEMVLDTFPFQGIFPRARIYQNAIPAALFKQFRDWALGIHPTPEGKTVWFPLNRSPRYLPEKVIAHLYRLIQRECKVRYLGAEWWMGYRKPEDSFHYHVDRDESLFQKTRKMVNPDLATILYVTGSGGATFIPNDFIRPETGKISRAAVTSSLKIFPRPNKYAAFSGNLFHSVLAGEPSSSPNAELRITFLVNFWNQRPHKPASIDPDPSFIVRSLKGDFLNAHY